MEENKKYTNPKIETIMIELCDVVTESDPGGDEPIVPTYESDELDDYNYQNPDE